MQEDRVEAYERDPMELKPEAGTDGTDTTGQEQKANRKLISKLVGEYNAYKKSKLLNFRFSPEGRSTMFGKF